MKIIGVSIEIVLSEGVGEMRQSESTRPPIDRPVEKGES